MTQPPLIAALHATVAASRSHTSEDESDRPSRSFFQQLFEQRHGGGGVELRGHGADEKRGIAECVQLKAEPREKRGVCFEKRRAVRVGVERLGLQKLLRHEGLFVQAHFVKEDALVRGMLVDEQHLVALLEQNVNVQRLADVAHGLDAEGLVQHRLLRHGLRRRFRAGRLFSTGAAGTAGETGASGAGTGERGALTDGMSGV